MLNVKKTLEEHLVKVKKYFAGGDTPESKKKIEKKKRLNLLLILLVGFISFLVLLSFISSEDHSQTSLKDQSDNDVIDSHQKIELGTDATGADTKWRNFLEDSIETEGKTRSEQIELLQKTINQHKESRNEEVQGEFQELKDRLSYALSQIERLKVDNKNIQNEIVSLSAEDNDRILPAELGITAINSNHVTKAPMSSFNYIPATSYVSGHLLGGIAVSTSVTSASEPIPVIIKLTSRGNLPKAFAVDMKQCRLLASCYGDISSERAIIRAEELVCEDKSAGLITSTKVAGVVYGDDGANGIRGTVVSMSEKHLKNAVIGGVLSGFSGAAKGQDGLNISSLGALSTKKRGLKDMAQDGLLGGTSSAAEKLADYHIKLAENISPVILVPGGTKVDIMFTKSVEVGSFDVEEVISAERVGQ
jgi:conjugal transfer pilus assembly protein TraB